MATSLVSTGIQFPDSSTQTTRAGWIPLTVYNAITSSVSITGIPDAAKDIRVVCTMSYSSGPCQPTIYATNSGGNFSHSGLVSTFSSSTVASYSPTNFITPQSYFMPSSIIIDIAYRHNPASGIQTYNYFVTAYNSNYLMEGTGQLSASSGYINGFAFATNSSITFSNLVAQVYYQL